MPTTWRVYKDNRQLASKDWGPLLYLLLVYARTSKIEHCLAWDDRAEGIFSVHFEELKALIETEIEEDDPEDAAEGGDDGGGKGADADDVREGKGKKSLSSDKKAARGARASPAKRRETIVTTGATSFEHLQDLGSGWSCWRFKDIAAYQAGQLTADVRTAPSMLDATAVLVIQFRIRRWIRRKREEMERRAARREEKLALFGETSSESRVGTAAATGRTALPTTPRTSKSAAPAASTSSLLPPPGGLATPPAAPAASSLPPPPTVRGMYDSPKVKGGAESKPSDALFALNSSKNLRPRKLFAPRLGVSVGQTSSVNAKNAWKVFAHDKAIASKQWGAFLYQLLAFGPRDKLAECLKWVDEGDGFFAVVFPKLKESVELEVDHAPDNAADADATTFDFVEYDGDWSVWRFKHIGAYAAGDMKARVRTPNAALHAARQVLKRTAVLSVFKKGAKHSASMSALPVKPRTRPVSARGPDPSAAVAERQRPLSARGSTRAVTPDGSFAGTSGGREMRVIIPKPQLRPAAETAVPTSARSENNIATFRRQKFVNAPARPTSAKGNAKHNLRPLRRAKSEATIGRVGLPPVDRREPKSTRSNAMPRPRTPSSGAGGERPPIALSTDGASASGEEDTDETLGIAQDEDENEHDADSLGARKRDDGSSSSLAVSPRPPRKKSDERRSPRQVNFAESPLKTSDSNKPGSRPQVAKGQTWSALNAEFRFVS